MMFAILHSWIAHNKRLATHGRRGNMTRYTPPSYSNDQLGRKLLFAPETTSARDVSLSVIEGCKVYVMAPPAREDIEPSEEFAAVAEKD